jgi:hypothetical protein
MQKLFFNYRVDIVFYLWYTCKLTELVYNPFNNIFNIYIYKKLLIKNSDTCGDIVY